MVKSVVSKALRAAKAAAYGTGEYVGFCLACGRKAKGVEPDARKLECAHCHAKRVYGAEEIVLMVG
jgi:DNA-directed RNA polymerase subunit RPC12/RpoP